MSTVRGWLMSTVRGWLMRRLSVCLLKEVPCPRRMLPGAIRDKRPGPKSGLEFLQPPRERYRRAPEVGGLKEELQELRVAVPGRGLLKRELETTKEAEREAESTRAETS